MSHFSVMVIQKEGNCRSLEDMLEKYNENAEGEAYIYKTVEELVQEGKETIKRYMEDPKMIDILDGMKKKDWGEKWYGDRAGTEEDKKSYIDTQWRYYQEYKKDLEDSKEWDEDSDYYDYAITCYDESEFDEDGNLLSYSNPEAKWDWWVVGGRWSGQLKIKKGRRSMYEDCTEVDSAEVGDIDWEAMFSLSPEDRQKAVAFWKYYVLEEPFPGTEEEKKEIVGFGWYKKEYYLDKYKTLDGYIEALSNWGTRAVVDDDGQWHEVGEMGWWGMSSESPDESADWEKKFYERFIKPLNKHDVITVIDCHI